MGRRFAIGALAASFGVMGLGLAAGLAFDAVPDIALGLPAAVLGFATATASVALRRLVHPVALALGLVIGPLLVFYATWLVDPAPTDVQERANLVFSLGLLGLWVAPVAASLGTSRWAGVAAGLLLFGALVASVAVRLPPGTSQLAVGAGVAAAGCLLAAAWAAALSRADTRADSRERASGLPIAPTILAPQWSVQLTDRVPGALRLAGTFAIGDGVIRLAGAPEVVATVPLEVAEGAFAGAWLLFVLLLRRAAPGIGAVTSVAATAWGLVLPLGLLWTALLGAAVLVPAATALPTGRLSSLELSNAAPIVLALGAARIAWITRAAPRQLGVLVVLLWAIGAASALGVAGGSPLPIVATGGATAAGIGWVLFGLWLVLLASRIRGRRPVDVFRSPGGSLPGVASPPGRQAGVRRNRELAPDGARPPGANAAGTRAERWRRIETPARLGVADLAARLGIPEDELRAADAAYATFAVPKRSGGMRTIAAPNPPTKALQRRILRRLLDRLPAHAAAHGFEHGRSIVTNAGQHRDPAVIVKLDVEDFFGRTRTARVRRYWRVLGWDREAARILTRLTTWEGGLPQGAPTSPRLANLVNVRLDARLSGVAAVHGAVYTRYADDLTFSFRTDDGRAVRQLVHAVRRICHDEARYHLHRSRKVEIRRRHERQEVTGLVVNDGPPRLSRARRRWLRSVEFRTYSGGTPTIDDEALRGWQALEAMIEHQAGAAPSP